MNHPFSTTLPTLLTYVTGRRDSFERGKWFYYQGKVEHLSEAGNCSKFLVEDDFADREVVVDLQANPPMRCTCDQDDGPCAHAAGVYWLLDEEIREEERLARENLDRRRYERDEMIAKVLEERRAKAQRESFRIEWNAGNPRGDHLVHGSTTRSYKVVIRDVEAERGYCSCPDYRLNKLGTCKHLMHVIEQLTRRVSRKQLRSRYTHPYIEIYCDPRGNDAIAWYYDGELSREEDTMLSTYFDDDQTLPVERYEAFLRFLGTLRDQRRIVVRPEVEERLAHHFEQRQLERLSEELEPDLESSVKATLYPYQKEGIRFALFKKGSILADEMGLGKTLQAIAVAQLKRRLFDFRRTLIICPASLKSQWRREIERFCGEQAVVIEGPRRMRRECYLQPGEAYFYLANYEAILRDITLVHQFNPDFVVLDEAQRIKNFETKTAVAIKSIPKKHGLVLTGTPLENRLDDLYSIMGFVDDRLLGPLWEFSMSHCYFDKLKKNKITGYYDLQTLQRRLSPVLLKREKRQVLEQMPDLRELHVPIALTSQQQEMHLGFSGSLAKILSKKFLTPYDHEKIRQLLLCMRMVCDSTYLIDRQTHFSPKLDELGTILIDKLDLRNKPRKVLLFTEWKEMQRLIAQLLRRHHLGFVVLNGDVPMKDRDALIREFEDNPKINVFLSTDAGGTGLNLQCADTVINFELPWNPAKKNQRIGRIDRIGQKAPKLTVINLYATGSIEARILEGLFLKQSLFDAVLSDKAGQDVVDLEAKNQAAYLSNLREMNAQLERDLLAEGQQQLDLLAEREITPSLDETATTLVETAAEREQQLGEVFPAEQPTEIPAMPPPPPAPPAPNPEELNQTLNQALGFLSGIMKLATGKPLVTGEAAVKIDSATGEVTLSFKLPGLTPPPPTSPQPTLG